jgi:hypothetical protein
MTNVSFTRFNRYNREITVMSLVDCTLSQCKKTR